MDECSYHKEFANEIKKNHLEIIDRLARIETKQDNGSALNLASRNDIANLSSVTAEQGKQIAALDRELKNIKWTAGVVASIATAGIELLAFISKGGK